MKDPVNEFEFVDELPDPEDADRINKEVITDAIGEIFPSSIVSIKAQKRPKRILRLCQYYLWYHQHCDHASSARRKRRKSMESVVAEFDDTDENQLYQSIYESYEDKAESDNALEQFEADLESLTVKYEIESNHAWNSDINNAIQSY